MRLGERCALKQTPAACTKNRSLRTQLLSTRTQKIAVARAAFSEPVQRLNDLRIVGRQLRQQLVPQTIAQDRRVGVALVDHIRNLLRCAIGFKLRFCKRQKRPQNIAVSRRHGCKSLHARAAQNIHQHCFSAVVGLMRQRQPLRLALLQDFRQRRMAQRVCCCFKAPPLRFFAHLHVTPVKTHAARLAIFLNKAPLFVRSSAQMMVDVRHFELVATGCTRTQQ